MKNDLGTHFVADLQSRPITTTVYTLHSVSISIVVSALASINVVNRHWARLVLGWVTACGRVKPSQYVTSNLGQLSFPSLRGR